MEREADAYIVFHLAVTGEVAVLSTIDRVYKRASKPQPVTPLHNRLAVESLVQEALSPVQKHEPHGTWRAAGSMSSSNNLHLDPRAVAARARGTSFRRIPAAEGEAAHRLERRVNAVVDRLATRRDAEGIVCSVAVARNDLKGDPSLYVALLEKDLSDDQVQERIEQYLDSCEAVPTAAPDPSEFAWLDALAGKLLDT